ncbi:hypothetical protein HKX48_002521 [Thoreauomyces humboldtii]|nr:hypothetical protein HKX48_002521 [Thoreauomyces humboldtii]
MITAEYPPQQHQEEQDLTDAESKTRGSFLLECPYLVLVRILLHLPWTDKCTLHHVSSNLRASVSSINPLVPQYHLLTSHLDKDVHWKLRAKAHEDVCLMADGIVSAWLNENEMERRISWKVLRKLERRYGKWETGSKPLVNKRWIRTWLTKQVHVADNACSEGVYQSVVNIPLDEDDGRGRTLVLSCFERHGEGFGSWRLGDIQITAEVKGTGEDILVHESVVWDAPWQFAKHVEWTHKRFSALTELAKRIDVPRASLNEWIAECFPSIGRDAEDYAGVQISVPLKKRKVRVDARTFRTNMWLLDDDTLKAFDRLRQLSIRAPGPAREAWESLRSRIARAKANPFLHHFPSIHHILLQTHHSELSSEPTPLTDATTWLKSNLIVEDFRVTNLTEGLPDGDICGSQFRLLFHFKVPASDTHPRRRPPVRFLLRGDSTHRTPDNDPCFRQDQRFPLRMDIHVLNPVTPVPVLDRAFKDVDGSLVVRFWAPATCLCDRKERRTKMPKVEDVVPVLDFDESREWILKPGTDVLVKDRLKVQPRRKPCGLWRLRTTDKFLTDIWR